jgi:hypothetical protein
MLDTKYEQADQAWAAPHNAKSINAFRAHSWRLAAAVVVLVLLACNYKLLVGDVAPQWDAADFFGPSFSLISDNIRAGHFLLWNPWTSGGSPDFADPELGTASPATLLAGVVFNNPRTGFVAYWMLIWIAGGIGMLLLVRHLQCPAWGAVISALGFVASGFLIGHAEHTSSLYSVAFVPWICWRFDDAILTGRYWSFIQAGVLYGLSAVGGYPQFTILTPGFLFFWMLGRLFFTDPDSTSPAARLQSVTRIRIKSVVGLVLVGVVGALIMCPSYLALVTETRGYSDRIGQRSRIESTGSNILPTGAITTLASPYLALLAYPGLEKVPWTPSDISMSSVYAGAVVMTLALLALGSAVRWRWWLAGVAILFLCTALGNQTPLRGWIYDLVLPTRYFRNASMFSSYTIFLLCILAALATRDIQRMRLKNARRFAAISAVVTLLAIVSFTIVVRYVPRRPFAFHLAVCQLAVTWIGITIIAVWMAYGSISARRCAQLLVVLAIVDASLTIIVSKPILYTEATREWWRQVSDRHKSGIDLTSQGLYRQLHVPPSLEDIVYPNNRNVPLKIPVLESYTAFLNRFERTLEESDGRTDFVLGRNRLWFAREAVPAAPTDELFAAFMAAMAHSHTPVIVLHTPGQMNAGLRNKTAGSTESSATETEVLRLGSVAPASAAIIDLIAYRPRLLRFEFQSPTQGWLMVTDRWAPGWKAKVNGKTVPVYGADFLFRAVPVSPGINDVEFRYQPRTWLPSLIVSAGTMLLFGVISLFRIATSRGQHSARAAPLG